MPEVKSYPHGAFCWADLGTTDQKAATDFYSQVFGWDAEDLDVGEGMSYTMFRIGGLDVAAAYTQPAEHASAGMPPAWNSYISVDDADQVAKQAEAAGGRVVAPAFDVLDSGRMAVIMDPAGAAVGLWQPAKHFGSRLSGELNTLSWNELITPDPAAARTFFSEVFGWTYEDLSGPNGTYTLIKNDEQPNGGIMEPPAEGMPAFWNVYFSVEDCDATISQIEGLGGRALMPALDVPDTGRVCTLADPQGAAFSVIQPAPMQDQ